MLTVLGLPSSVGGPLSSIMSLSGWTAYLVIATIVFAEAGAFVDLAAPSGPRP